MSIHNFGYQAREAANIGTAANGVWEDCPELEILLNPLKGYRFFDEFNGGMNAGSTGTTVGGWRFTQLNGAGTFVLTDEAGGVALLDSVTATDEYGGQIQLATTVGEQFIPAAAKDLWFETRVAVDIITDDFFLGLSTIDSTLVTASGAITTANHIGFKSLTGDGVILCVGEKAGDASTDTSATFEAGTYVRLGLKVTTLDAALRADFYVDGVAIGTLAAAYVPIVEMTPSFVCQSGGTAAPIMSIDWVKAIQLR